MNSDLISKSALREKISSYVGVWDDDGEFMVGMAAVLRGIDSAPAVDAVVLPCKVGALVWKIDERFTGRGRERWPILRCMVMEFSTDIVDTYAVLSGAEDWFAITRFAAVPISDFGKTVFLTREEAEAAVKRRGKHEWN